MKMEKPKTKREQNKAETRERLMAAARYEFARKGFAGTSLRNITSLAGLSTGAFYNNFRDKKEIYLAILDELSSKLRGIVEEGIQEFLEARWHQPKNNPTLELLRQAISGVIKEANQNRDLFEILRKDGLGIGSDFGPDYRRIVREFVDPMREGLDQIIAAGLSGPYDTEALAHVGVVLFFSMGIYVSEDKSNDLEGWVDTIAAMIHGGAKQLAARRPLTVLKDVGLAE